MEAPRILIVDDERDLRNLLKTALQKEGYTEIETAANVAEGWAAFQQFAPHIALLDIMLPDGKAMIYAEKFAKYRIFRFYA